MADHDHDHDQGRGRGRALWLSAVAVLVLAGGAVPYGLMAGPDAGLSVAAFWGAFGLAVIALIALATLRWRD